MGFSDFFNWSGSSSGADEIPNLFPLSIAEKLFVETEVKGLYAKILTDVVERTEGLTDDDLAVLWDNCLASESCDGLITMLSKAMCDKADLFLVLDEATNVLRKATQSEQTQIKKDYETQAESKTGVYVSFKNYSRTDMIKVYSALEYSTVSGLNKTMNLSKAVQIKIADLRKSVSLIDADIAKAQAQKIATALKEGRDVGMDAADVLETGNPNLEPIKATMQLLNEKRAFYLNMPASYITGELNSGLGDSGQADVKAVERGLRGYFVSIVKPVCKALFGADLTFKSDDFVGLQATLECLKTFELTSDEYISAENKLRVINKLFGFPDDTEGGPIDQVQPPADPKQAAPAVPPQDQPQPRGA